jgi:transcriptional regulator with XRE-family HTH domain
VIFSEKLLVLRKSKGLTQEELAEKFHVSRQAIAKWESGQSYPDISNIIAISEFFRVTIDHLVKDNNNCTTAWSVRFPGKRRQL